MRSKVLALQKMMAQTFFLSKPQTVKGIRRLSGTLISDILARIVLPVIVYLVGLRLFGGLMGVEAIFLVVIQQVYRIADEEDSIIFRLPLKRTFMIGNVFLYSVLMILGCNLLVLVGVFSFGIFGELIILLHSFSGQRSDPIFTGHDLAMIQEILVNLAFVITYMSGMITCFFIRKSKIRVVFMAVYTAICCGMALFIYTLLPKDPKSAYFNIADSLTRMPNSWAFAAGAFAVSIAVTIAGIFIASGMRGARSKKKPKNL